MHGVGRSTFSLTEEGGEGASLPEKEKDRSCARTTGHYRLCRGENPGKKKTFFPLPPPFLFSKEGKGMVGASFSQKRGLLP